MEALTQIHQVHLFVSTSLDGVIRLWHKNNDLPFAQFTEPYFDYSDKTPTNGILGILISSRPRT